MCVLVCWFFCALLWLLPMGILPLPVRVCVRPWCSPVCAKLSAKVRKTGIIRLRKRYFFYGYSYFSLCESAKILYKILKHHVLKQLTSAASFSDKPRLVAQHLLPSSPKGHAFLAQKQCRFWCKNVRFFVISADEMDIFQLLLVMCGSLSSWYSACLQKRFLLLVCGPCVQRNQKSATAALYIKKIVYKHCWLHDIVSHRNLPDGTYLSK